MAPQEPTNQPGPPPLPTQRRRNERIQLEVEVSLESDHNFYSGFSTNISEGGIFVATHVLCPVGTQMEITFSLPGQAEPIAAVAEVRWQREYNELSNTPPGLGLRFVAVGDADLQRIQAFTNTSREPLFHEE